MGPIESNIACINCDAFTSLSNMNKGCFFVHMPLKSQLLQVFSNNMNIFETEHIRNSMHSSINDYSDGVVYKKLKDGVSIFKSKKKSSLWPIQMVINELPVSIRYKTENIIITDIWYEQDPNFSIFLKPLYLEMEQLNEENLVIQHKKH